MKVPFKKLKEEFASLSDKAKEWIYGGCYGESLDNLLRNMYLHDVVDDDENTVSYFKTKFNRINVILPSKHL